jgi:hypothetical protein
MAKTRKYSTNSLPSVTLDKEVSVNCRSTTVSLSNIFCWALGNLVLSKEKLLSWRPVTLMEPLPSVGSPLPSARVPVGQEFDKESSSGPLCQSLCECSARHLARLPLCRVSAGLALDKGSTSGPLCESLCRVAKTLGKKALPVPRCAFFAEFHDHSTHQSTSLSSVALSKVTRKP